MTSNNVIKVSERISDNLGTRRSADELFEFIEALPQKSITLDFKGVTFMSRSFAHQYMTNKKNADKKLVETNMASVVKKMMSIVRKQGNSSYGNRSSSFMPVAVEKL